MKVAMEESPKTKKPQAREAADERPLREQLLEAQARIQREIEILQSPSGIYRAPDCREEKAALENELREINDALANLGSDES